MDRSGVDGQKTLPRNCMGNFLPQSCPPRILFKNNADGVKGGRVNTIPLNVLEHLVRAAPSDESTSRLLHQTRVQALLDTLAKFFNVVVIWTGVRNGAPGDFQDFAVGGVGAVGTVALLNMLTMLIAARPSFSTAGENHVGWRRVLIVR